jgi:hypothetical protein
MDLTRYRGWYVVCSSRRCAGRTVLGRLSDMIVQSVDEAVAELAAGTNIHQLSLWYEGRAVRDADGVLRMHRYLRRKTNIGLVLGPGSGYWPEDEKPNSYTSESCILLTERVGCPKCGWILSLNRLTARDLRPPRKRWRA